MATSQDEFRPDDAVIELVLAESVMPRLAWFESDGAPEMFPSITIAVRDDILPFRLISSSSLSSDGAQNGECRLRFRQTAVPARVLYRIESLFPNLMPDTGFVGFDAKGYVLQRPEGWIEVSKDWTGKYNVNDWHGW